MANTPEHNVTMTRSNLENVAIFDWPDGFSVRAYELGDDENWWHIHERADPLLAHRGGSHRQFFGEDAEELRARQWFVVAPQGETIGTATAWHDDAATGRVHWVAIVPEFQGRGLAKPLLSHILITLRELGHQRAVLGTSLERPHAIGLYEKFGFSLDA